MTNDTDLSHSAATMAAMKEGTLLAAVDLGSNSFRLEIGRYEHGQIHRVDQLKETVRLGGGLDDERHLTEDAMQRGWDCLARFSERLQGFKPRQVRAVATQTLREARNRDAFLHRGCERLGFPIEVIAGTEEARLIYQGVAQMLPQSQERRLVVDIGGRSTELILGQDRTAHETHSFRLGSVSWSMKYFPQGRLTEQALQRAEIAAQAVLEEALTLYPRTQWDVAYGASGTVSAVAEILAQAGWPEGVIELEGVRWLRKCLLRAGHVHAVHLEGLKEDRRAVIGGGVSVLHALMGLLRIDTLHVAEGALRQGVLFEMVERADHSRDTRDTSVNRLAIKLGVDLAQAERVQRQALRFLRQTQAAHDDDELARMLGWACQLHEVGMAISHSDYHKHGAYILDNADMLGFGMPELHQMGLLVLGHKGKLRKLEAALDDMGLAQMLMALRLAVIVCHARQEPDTDALHLTLSPEDRCFTLHLSRAWREAHPQSSHLLQVETQVWERSPWQLALHLA